MPTKPGSRKRNYGNQPAPRGGKMQHRQRSKSEYHTHRWTKDSRAFRSANPLCIRCLLRGEYTPTEVTNHIVPSELWPDFFDRNNREPLCKPCNIIQGNEDKQLITQARGGKLSPENLDIMRRQRVQVCKKAYKKAGLKFKQL